MFVRQIDSNGEIKTVFVVVGGFGTVTAASVNNFGQIHTKRHTDGTRVGKRASGRP